MPKIEISDETFARLQQLAVPFVDTPETVILRLLGGPSHPEGLTQEIYKKVIGGSGVLSDYEPYEAVRPPSLTHTRLVRAFVDSEELYEQTWNGLLKAALVAAWKRQPSFSQIKATVGIGLSEGVRTDSGYQPVQGTRLSVQGQDANGAWRASVSLARKLGFPISAEFVWLDKPEAWKAGGKGRLQLL